MEYFVASADAVSDEDGIHTVLWVDYRSLYDLFVLRKSGVFLFQRIDLLGDGFADGKRGNIHKGKRTKVPVSALEECADINQFWPYTMRLFYFLRIGQNCIYLALYPSTLSDLLLDVVQYRCRIDSVRLVRVFQGYTVSMVHLHDAVDVYVSNILYD